MRLRVLVLCTGIAAHSKMAVILIESLWLAELALAIVFMLAVLTSAGIRRSNITADQQAGATRCKTLVMHGVCWWLLFVCGFLWAMLMAQIQLQQRLPVQLEGVDFWLTGRIEGLVRREPVSSQPSAGNQRSQQFDLRVNYSCFRLLPAQCTDSNQNPVLAGQLVTLNDYARLPVQSGENWLLRVRVNRPHGFANPGGFDFEARQFQRGIMARGYVRETAFNTRLPAPDGFLAGLWSQLNISRLRATLAEDIEQLSGISNSGLLKALVVGDRGGISNAQWDLFTATGTNHLIVISGMHVGFVALCAWTLVNWLSRWFPALLLWVPAQHLAAFAAIVAAACYSLLAGFTLPTQRALIMIVVLMANRIRGRPVAPADTLCTAALLVLLMDPMAVTQAGFWLSFIAVASLFFAFTGYSKLLVQTERRHVEQVWQRWMQPQWVVSVGLLLPLLLWTGQMSLNAPLANVFAIPLVSLLVVPMALPGAMLLLPDVFWVNGIATWLLQLADSLLAGMQRLLTIISAWTPGLWRPPAPSLMTMILMAISSAVLLMPRGLAPRWLALPMLLPLIWPAAAARPPPGRVWLQFLDVGQGLAVAVHTQNHNLLFDTGPALGPDFDTGQAVIVPYLHQSRITRLDSLVISHWHADHSGGLASVVNAVDVGKRLAGTPETNNPTSFDRYGFRPCKSGQQWHWDDVSFTVLFPPANTGLQAAGAASGNINNTSCVLLIEAGGQRVLLTGDIEQPAERWLLAEHAGRLDVDILQAPHHGSRSSSSPAFVEATSAQWVIMSAGYRNRFDHPHDDVTERYTNHGAQLFLTAYSGAVLMEIGGAEPVLLSGYRQQQRRFWFNL